MLLSQRNVIADCASLDDALCYCAPPSIPLARGWIRPVPWRRRHGDVRYLCCAACRTVLNHSIARRTWRFLFVGTSIFVATAHPDARHASYSWARPSIVEQCEPRGPREGAAGEYPKHKLDVWSVECWNEIVFYVAAVQSLWIASMVLIIGRPVTAPSRASCSGARRKSECKVFGKQIFGNFSLTERWKLLPSARSFLGAFLLVGESHRPGDDAASSRKRWPRRRRGTRR